jgi:soluble cytochrome b562
MADNIVLEKIDRLENHFKVYKTDMQDVKDVLKSVENSLVGSNLNGNKGMIHLLDDIDKRVHKIEEKQILYDETMKNYKWGIRSLILGICSLIYWLFTKDK